MGRVLIGLGVLVALALVAVALLRPGGGLMPMRPTAEDWVPPVEPARARPLPQRRPCAHRDPLRRAFFGDLHVHTHYSMDARSRDMLATPDDAYRFARGEEIGFGPFDERGEGKRRGQLERPLDFAAVTDHAEWIGEVNVCTRVGSPGYASESCRAYRGEVASELQLPGLKFLGRMTALIGLLGRREDICGPEARWCRASLASAWQETQRATERWNDTSESCRFTTFHGWEHSYSVDQSKVHRNVIFRNASVPEIPISSLEAPEALELWNRLDALCTNAGAGCEVLTIPHNPNVSNGRLFEITWADEPLEEQRRQARQRARLERLVEMMQVKGESECRNGLWGVAGAEDELCGFEKIRGLGPPEDCRGGIGSGALRGDGCQSRVDFARYALAEGLRQEELLGVNPFRFGMIGSTDTHNANPGDVEEYSYIGCCADTDAPVGERLSLAPSFAGTGWVMRNPGGLMGVWADENSRDALFDAMQRRETFATSGPRIQPRFFASWGDAFPEGSCARSDLVATGYARGVPMGAVLPEAPGDDTAPTFLTFVARDPGAPGHPGGRLDRLQIVKVWHDDEGRFHQAVHDVAGRLAEGGAPAPSVDLASCEPDGRGANALCAVWSDPDFDAGRRAAYYARVVESPSCRWSWRQCLALPEAEQPKACRDPDVPRTIQERAWTSPIWVGPRAELASR